MRRAAIAAPYPLSILTTTKPGAQLANIPSRAVRPFKLTPYPTETGTPMTGVGTSPVKTVGKAPSIPAQAIKTRALLIISSLLNNLCKPETPTSTISSVLIPCIFNANGR